MASAPPIDTRRGIRAAARRDRPDAGPARRPTASARAPRQAFPRASVPSTIAIGTTISIVSVSCPARHREIDFGQQLGVEHGAVQRSMSVGDAEAFAQRIETVLLAGKVLARQRQRIDDIGGQVSDGRQIDPLQLLVDEGDIERARCE